MGWGQRKAKARGTEKQPCMVIERTFPPWVGSRLNQTVRKCLCVYAFASVRTHHALTHTHIGAHAHTLTYTSHILIRTQAHTNARAHTYTHAHTH